MVATGQNMNLLRTPKWHRGGSRPNSAAGGVIFLNTARPSEGTVPLLLAIGLPEIRNDIFFNSGTNAVFADLGAQSVYRNGQRTSLTQVVYVWLSTLD